MSHPKDDLGAIDHPTACADDCPGFVPGETFGVQKIERCDDCQRFETDDAARAYLRRGATPGERALARSWYLT